MVHSEMPSDEFLKSGGQSEGFQLWVNLPAKDKFARPRYQDTPPENIPVVKSQGTAFVLRFMHLHCVYICIHRTEGHLI